MRAPYSTLTPRIIPITYSIYVLLDLTFSEMYQESYRTNSFKYSYNCSYVKGMQKVKEMQQQQKRFGKKMINPDLYCLEITVLH